jgi:hypothetical protein
MFLAWITLVLRIGDPFYLPQTKHFIHQCLHTMGEWESPVTSGMYSTDPTSGMYLPVTSGMY